MGGSQPPVPTVTLLSKLCPLILDGSASVRNQLLKLVSVLPLADITDHASVLLPYVRAGMTHLSAEIRISAVNLLSWLVGVAGEEVVSCPGGWHKTLECFVTMLGWNTCDHEKWSKNKFSVSRFAGDGRTLSRNLQVLSEFVRAGIGPGDEMIPVRELPMASRSFTLWHSEHHVVPTKANAYGYLNLFGAAKDDENQMLDDREDRIRVFEEAFKPAIMAGLEAGRKEGGEPGRAAGLVSRAIKESQAED